MSDSRRASPNSSASRVGAENRPRRHRAAAREPSGRKPGGQPGHKGHRRELLTPTRTTECFPESCRGCGKSLPKVPDENPLRQQVIDLPVVTPDVDEFRRHRVRCQCGVLTCGAPPVGTPSGIIRLDS